MRPTVTQRAAEAFGDWPPETERTERRREAIAQQALLTDRPPIVAQAGAELEPVAPADALTCAVDNLISAWAYMLTATHGRDERRDARELFAAAIGALIDARQRYREATE